MADYTTKGSFNLGNQITLKNKNSNIDRDYGPYEGKTPAEIATLLEATIQAGKTIGVIEEGKVVEYWWQPVEGGNAFVEKGKAAIEDTEVAELETEAKTIVEAINEIKRIASEGGGGGDVDLSGIEQDIADLQTAVGENTTAIAGKQDKITVETIRGDILEDIYYILEANIIYDIYTLCTNNTTVVEIQFEGNPNESGQHYMMRLHFQDDATEISVAMYSAITWYGGNEPEWQAGKTYEISILDGLAIYAEFDTPTTE